MAFFGRRFIWDGTSSDLYGLYVTNFKTGLVKSDAGSNVTPIRTLPYRRSKQYFFGVTQDEILEVDLELTSAGRVDGHMRSLMKRWLFGSIVEKKLQILQCDIDEVYFNGILTNVKDIYVGNIHQGFSCTMSCDSPWGWTFPKTITRPYGGGIANDTFTFYNDTDDADYLYPAITFTLNAIGDSFGLVNTTDDSRAFTFTDISALEVMTVDNSRQIVSSSTGLNRLGKFNKNWLRLLPGNNSLTLTGGVSEFTMTYQFARKIGG